MTKPPDTAADPMVGSSDIRAGTARPNWNLRWLEIFVVVARTGTMTAAAEQLKLTQPAISQAIANLEDAVGVPLLDRSVRPPALTLQGTVILKYASAVLASVEELHNAIRLGETGQVPLLRIGMLNSFAATMGPSVIARLRDMAAEWWVDSGYRASRVQALVERKLDFIVTADESPLPTGVVAMPILSEPFLVIVPASYEGDPRAIETLCRDLDMIRFGRDPFMVSRIDHRLYELGAPPQRRYQFDTSDAVLQMVAAGLGWTLLPVLAVFRAIARGEAIRAAPLPGKGMRRTVMVVARSGVGAHVAERIRDAAADALHTIFMTRVAEVLPEIASEIEILPRSASLGTLAKRPTPASSLP